MPTNNNPRGNQGVFAINLRPNQISPGTFDPIIERHGQYVRIIRSMPCPVVNETSGHSMRCKVCYGRGEIYNFQRDFRIFLERPPHGKKNPYSCEAGLIKPWINPIIGVGKIILFRSDPEGGMVELEYESFTKDSIKLKQNLDLFPCSDGYPESHMVLIIDYTVDNWDEFSQEFIGDGETLNFNLNIPLPIKDILTNDREVKRIITEILDIKNKNDEKIHHKTFYGNSVYFENPPIKDVKFTIMVNIANPIKLVIQPLTTKFARTMNWDMESGNMMAVLSDSWEFGKGDIVTCLMVDDKMSEIIVRTNSKFDILPYFDISRIDEFIIDTDGKKYKNKEDFVLWDYNKIKWIGEIPGDGKKYSAVFWEHPSYRAMNSNAEINSNENKHLPKNIQLERIGKFIPASINVGTKKESVSVGDWTKKYGGFD